MIMLAGLFVNIQKWLDKLVHKSKCADSGILKKHWLKMHIV